MDERIKYGLQIVALVVAAFVGYGVAQVSVTKLNEKVIDVTLKLGGLQRQIQELETGSTGLRARVTTMDTALGRVEAADIKLAADFLQAVGKNRNAATLLADVINRRPAFDCKTIEKKSNVSNDMHAVAQDLALIKEGYRLVSGACSYGQDEQNSDRPLVLTNALSGDDGWRCWYKNPRATTVTAVARYCRIVP